MLAMRGDDENDGDVPSSGPEESVPHLRPRLAPVQSRFSVWAVWGCPSSS
jgi:hypothetical protein